jgi:hypothetical protein
MHKICMIYSFVPEKFPPNQSILCDVMDENVLGNDRKFDIDLV